MRIPLFALLLMLAGCGSATYGTLSKTSVDGKEFSVMPMTSDPGTWVAIPAKGGRIYGATQHIGATKAIEQVSGCKVIPETISNLYAQTFAAVDCK